jgi:hypothetical protein
MKETLTQCIIIYNDYYVSIYTASVAMNVQQAYNNDNNNVIKSSRQLMFLLNSTYIMNIIL